MCADFLVRRCRSASTRLLLSGISTNLQTKFFFFVFMSNDPARVRGVVAHVHERHGVRFECAAVAYADGQRGTSTGNVRERDGCGVRRDVRGARMPRRVTEPRQLPSKITRGSPFPGMHRENASDGLTTI